jgi:hypothetical protein
MSLGEPAALVPVTRTVADPAPAEVPDGTVTVTVRVALAPTASALPAA